MARTVKPMCCVSIGYQDFLLPADIGMKLVALMNDAICTKKHYMDKGFVYAVGEQPSVEYVSVRTNQVIVPNQRQIEGIPE